MGNVEQNLEWEIIHSKKLKLKKKKEREAKVYY